MCSGSSGSARDGSCTRPSRTPGPARHSPIGKEAETDVERLRSLFERDETRPVRESAEDKRDSGEEEIETREEEEVEGDAWDQTRVKTDNI
jgi:hypothetical protein